MQLAAVVGEAQAQPLHPKQGRGQGDMTRTTRCDNKAVDDELAAPRPRSAAPSHCVAERLQSPFLLSARAVACTSDAVAASAAVASSVEMRCCCELTVLCSVSTALSRLDMSASTSSMRAAFAEAVASSASIASTAATSGYSAEKRCCPAACRRRCRGSQLRPPTCRCARPAARTSAW